MKNKELDSIDRRILQILMQDANASYVDIAKQIFVSAATIHVRVKNLKAKGIITHARTYIDLEELGYNVIAFIAIHLDRSSYYSSVVEALERLPEIIKLHYTTGQYSLLAQVICKDTRHLYDLLQYDIQSLKGVQKTESFLSLDEPIDRPMSIIREGDLE